ncbi:ABC transporter ATP-binding protein [Candidatus Dependentiae bacterium]|nr:ABC transporter ATP-binding protein [Candidatus Dependentiae bacterium]
MKSLTIKNLLISFNGSGSFKLHIENLNIKKGEYISIIGQNGSGKSTLLKTIAGLTEKYSGEILIDDTDIRKIGNNGIAKKIAYVPQFNSGLRFFNFTVFEFVLTGRFPYINKFAGYTHEDKEIVRNVIEYLRIEKYSDRKMSTLSGGELQKAAIGAALAQQSDILLFDEVNAFLDYKHKLELDEILQRLLEREETIISVTHNINDESVKSGKILALKNGEMIYFGCSSDFFKNDGLEKVYDVKFCESKIDKLNRNIFIAYKI